MDARLEAAARSGDADAVESLSASVDVNARNRKGQTALMLAAIKGHTDVVRGLLRHGAEPDLTAKHRLTALMLATLNGRVETVRALLDAGADRTLRATGAPSFDGRTALELAVARGDRVLVDLLQGSEQP